MKLLSRLYLPDEFIVHKGQKDFGLLLLYKGKIEVLQGDSRTDLEEGESFGLPMMLYDVPAGASLRTVNYVDMFELSKEDFLDVCRSYPECFEEIKYQAQDLYKIPIVLQNTVM